jgi:hypothetical protein
MNSKVKIYSDKRYLKTPKHMECILFPFWGYKDDPKSISAGKFQKWADEGKKYFEMVPLAEADVAIYPMAPNIDPQGFKRFQKETGNKRLLVFFNNDSDEKLEYRHNTYVFRTSFNKSSQRPREFAFPGNSEDWGILPVREWKPKPTVGFCGQYARPRLRGVGLDILDRSPLVKTNFLRRQGFWGGWFNRGKKPGDGKRLRKAFVDNIRDTDYTYCVRGGGNFSYRIYQTMMSGRIPVLVNTDCVLPYDFHLKWKGLIPIVEKKDIENIAEVILEFHNSIEHEYETWQRDMRWVWEEYLSPHGFFKNIHSHWDRKTLNKLMEKK